MTEKPRPSIARASTRQNVVSSSTMSNCMSADEFKSASPAGTERGRQLDARAASAFLSVEEADAAAEPFDRRVGEEQADAHAALRRLGRKEELPRAPLDFLGHAGTLVDDVDDDVAAFGMPRHLEARRRGVRRVVEQVEQRLLERLIGEKPGAAARPTRPPPPRQAAGAASDRPYVEKGVGGLRAASFAAHRSRGLGQRVEDSLASGDLALQQGDVGCEFRLLRVTARHVLGQHADRRERRSELVRRARAKGPSATMRSLRSASSRARASSRSRSRTASASDET